MGKTKDKIRQIPLEDRLPRAKKMISEMCREYRPPHMSIPVSVHDEDIFIVTTLGDALDQITKMKKENEVLRVWMMMNANMSAEDVQFFLEIDLEDK